MDNIIGHIISVFMGFFAIMNPVANLPVFLGLTEGLDKKTRQQIARKSLTFTFVIIAVFSIAGNLIFSLFGISLAAFQLTGGILVFLIGFNMLHGESSKVHQASGETDDQQTSVLSIALSPLAIPILAGPGTIATAMNFASTGGVQELVITLVTFFLLCLLTYLFFISGERFVKYIGNNGIKVVTQLMGLILAVIGVQMLIDAISTIVKTM